MDETGKPVAQTGKQVGEIWVRGDTVTQGYWNNPKETRAAFRNDWLKTGDLAVIDEKGFVNHGFTKRSGGSCPPPFDSLNLAFDIGDDELLGKTDNLWTGPATIEADAIITNNHKAVIAVQTARKPT